MPPDFKFPTRGSRKVDLAPGSLFEADAEEAEQPGMINGRPAASMEEYRVAKALWKLGRDFIYQFPLFGGTSVRGGYVLDFLVDPDGVIVPLEVQGERWHSGQFASGEQLRKAMIESYLDAEIKYVWEPDLQSDEAALEAVKKAIA